VFEQRGVGEGVGLKRWRREREEVRVGSRLVCPKGEVRGEELVKNEGGKRRGELLLLRNFRSVRIAWRRGRKNAPQPSSC